MIKVKINGKEIQVPEHSTVLQACTDAGVYIPTLCNHPDLPPAGKCGVCVVKINGSNYSLSCSTKVVDGMTIETNTPEIKEKAMEALNKFNDMGVMPAVPEIEDIIDYLVPTKTIRLRGHEETTSLTFDPKLCINCTRCSRACSDEQTINAIDELSAKLCEGPCISCGQCITVCPTRALRPKNDIPKVIHAMAGGKVCILQTAPSARVSVGECFGDPIGTLCTGKIISAAKEMGFQYIFDTNFGADMTIVEEGTELIDRINNGGVLPMFTSCCPGWVNFVEKIHPEIIPNLSTSKSPHMMAGTAIKTYWAEKMNIPKENIFTVSLMPCVAKKDEIQRKQILGIVDAVLSVVEFGELCKMFGVKWDTLDNNAQYDSLLGESTGAAALFGVTGGVMEAALRFAHEQLNHEKLGKVEYTQWRGFQGIKTASTTIAGINMKIAVCNGISNAREFIESGQYLNYTFIEVMACPCGCIGGGGQPKTRSHKEAQKRAKTIYELDRNTKKITSNDNEELKTLYKSYFGTPGNEKSHEFLHTSYEIQTTPFLEQLRKSENLPLVAYGSVSGTASRLARTFAEYIGTTTSALSMVNLNRMIKQGTIIIFCSTFGDGELPSNAEKFVNELRESNNDLSKLRYSVCALGSNLYPKFCAAGHLIDKLLEEKGAHRIHNIIELDSNTSDKGEGIFESWCPEILQSLGLKMPEIIIKPNYTLTKEENIDENDPIYKYPLNPIGYEYGVMLSSTKLTPEGYQPAMHRYQIKLPKGMKYDTGDHVAILPQNNPEVVKTIINELKLNPNDIYKVETTLTEGLNSIPERVTIHELFAQYLDLNGRPTRNLCRAYKQYITNEELKKELENILDISQPKYFEDLQKDINISEFIIKYGKSNHPPLDILVTAIPPIKPRLYSIASAPEANSYSIDLIITDNMFGVKGERNGLCTSFLRRFGLTKVPIHTQKGCFVYPKNKSHPIFMAALGCGIAPMLSLLQHRDSIEKPIGDAALFFGCRYRDTYPILDSMLEDYRDTNTMQDLFVAYSRSGKTKTYITDLMLQNPDVVWKYWQ
ncbi:Iron only hydrogenase large subunit, C-terminal domain containing protein [Histomonas meleagridis]|uniref:Iron only hydrogenase large subunit, C-terminal domain containing protein n=1 Tax=Histomonas meleagridis TaxID=135588 RepID=UPI00355A1BBA|nr:Iron only hydrogenase large subunit, C-terminal domain containing protein [Histomonas meleagridis]KAH0800881.1 Iron only hydrogenase large subunit, C-terminal domain containing protein [Histomonas meleagridis]